MKEDLLKQSYKRELSESDLRTRLNVILTNNIADYGLRSLGITRLEHLLAVDYKTLVLAQEQGKIRGLDSIRRSIHRYGCVLKGEYEDLGITEEEALIPIRALQINTRARNSLLRSSKVYVLGDLLAMDQMELSNIKYLGKKSYDELCSYLIDLGYNIVPVEDSVSGMKEQLRENGEVLVDDVVGSRKVMLALNRAGIYSLDQLLAVSDVHSIPGIGDTMSKVVVESLRSLNLSNEETIEAGNEVLASLTEERNQLRMRKAALLVEQAEVDAKLKEVSSSINKICGGNQYGKK